LIELELVGRMTENSDKIQKACLTDMFAISIAFRIPVRSMSVDDKMTGECDSVFLVEARLLEKKTI
jgi:hypothetical protein